jgi:DNA-binding XRE family transcriptional regulator
LTATVETLDLRHVARGVLEQPTWGLAVARTRRSRDDPDVGCALDRLGKRIRALRLDCKLTQRAAAARARLAETHWHEIEGARTNPTVATLVGVARALRVTLPALFDHDET